MTIVQWQAQGIRGYGSSGRRWRCAADLALADLALAGLALAVLPALVAVPASAAPPKESFSAFIEEIWSEAKADGISRATFESAVFELEPDLSLPDLDRPPPKNPAKLVAPSAGQAEFVKSASQYLEPVRLASLTQMGRTFQVVWKPTLDRIERESGVSRHILLAIWGRESIFGTYPLRYNAIRSLATQAYTGRRRSYFRKEFLAALRILQAGHVERDAMGSSWAGAMGLTQFMPTSFEKFAVDHDGDGRKNIWTSVPDSLASTAAFLQNATRRKWKLGTSWGYEIRRSGRFDCTFEGVEQTKTIRQWRKLGAKRTRNRKFRRKLLDEKAYLYAPDGAHGPAFLIHDNFQVIKAYNPPDVYALYVGHLADRIAGGLPFETPWSDLPRLTAAEFVELQQLLIKAGYEIGKADGRGSARMRVAIGRYQRSQKLAIDCYPQTAVLDHLRHHVATARAD